ncbi:cyclase family protein [Janibacter alittae]|uniref:Cyclase family protein n=1 Tax=Janibacter alittae TaxID=3115209 RepID=A0ABZ2MLQ1_9MICO
MTNALSADTPTLRLPDPFANLIDFELEEVSAYNTPGPFWKHHNIRTGEHIGTHVDAPVHWISGKDGHDVSTIPVHRLIGPAAVIDVRARVDDDPDFLLDIADIQEWEAQHGRLPENGWLLVRTGWDRFSNDKEAFLNTDESGSHTPGITAQAAEWLATQRPISGYGVDTVGIDAGRGAELEPPFPAHYHLLGNDKYGVTSLQNLAQLPPTGAMLLVSPLPILGGTGSPARVLALVEHD